MYLFLGLIAVWVLLDLGWGYRKAKDKRSYLVKSLAGMVAVALIFFLFGPFFMISPIKIGYSSLVSTDVTVYYPSVRTTQGKQIFEMAQQAVQKNRDFYGQVDHTKVLVATSDLDMLRFGVYPKGNGGGLSWGVVIRESRASWNIIAHEMSHKNLSKVSGIAAGTLKYPRWFDEGLASYLGSMDYYLKPNELAREVQEGRYQHNITHWQGLPGTITWIYHTFYGSGAHLIYGQTYLMVKFLFDTYGKDKVYQLVTATPQANFDQAFLETFGLSVDQFHQEFLKSI